MMYFAFADNAASRAFNSPIPDSSLSAQMIISAHEKADWIEVDVLEDSERGAGGFGHTGTN